MNQRALLSAVRNDGVEFATMRPRDSPFAVLDRDVVVTAPPELRDLSTLGDPDVLVALVELLGEPDRAWAAEVVLAAMTGRETKEVEAYSTRPDEWWAALGRGAQERWKEWLDEVGDTLHWDAAAHRFIALDG